jgi:tetratricopeptide (TPR) repeat protein
MLRFQVAIASLLGSLLVVPAFLGQGQIATLEDALAGTRRALEVLKGLEQRLQQDPAAALGLILSATEAPGGDPAQADQSLETLRNEVNLLQMELDAMLSPVLGADGAVESALGARLPLDPSPARDALGTPLAPSAGVTTGLDDSLRALLSEAPAARAGLRGEAGPARERGQPGASAPARGESAYTADPLRHGITCYRAGRFAEAFELLAQLDGATALYWQARTLERLERLDEAVQAMERAIARGGEGFEQRRAQTDLEFLRWKRDFVASLPSSGAAKEKKPAGKEAPR